MIYFKKGNNYSAMLAKMRTESKGLAGTQPNKKLCDLKAKKSQVVIRIRNGATRFLPLLLTSSLINFVGNSPTEV